MDHTPVACIKGLKWCVFIPFFKFYWISEVKNVVLVSSPKTFDIIMPSELNVIFGLHNTKLSCVYISKTLYYLLITKETWKWKEKTLISEWLIDKKVFIINNITVKTIFFGLVFNKFWKLAQRELSPIDLIWIFVNDGSSPNYASNK